MLSVGQSVIDAWTRFGIRCGFWFRGTSAELVAAWGPRKRMSRLTCRLGGADSWGPRTDVMLDWRIHWRQLANTTMIRARRRCGLISNYFYHLSLLLLRLYIQISSMLPMATKMHLCVLLYRRTVWWQLWYRGILNLFWRNFIWMGKIIACCPPRTICMEKN